MMNWKICRPANRPNKFLIQVVGLFLAMSAILYAVDVSQKLQMLGAVTSGRGIGVALVKNRETNQVKAFKVGSPVFDLGTLVQVERGSLVIKTPDKSLVTLSTKFGGLLSGTRLAKKPIGETDGETYSEDGLERKGNKTVIDASTKDRMLREDLPKFLMQASSEPVVQNGAIVGFRIFQFEPDSIYAKLGMKDGDIVKEINGVPLNDVAKTVQFLNGLRNESQVAIQVVRGGQPVSLELSVR